MEVPHPVNSGTNGMMESTSSISTFSVISIGKTGVVYGMVSTVDADIPMAPMAMKLKNSK
ncbi:MAG: hypothetical protein K2H71_03985 [Muribaculaceae bacterium]|nr:hypothetical protein [Muribaculaceae bacterium]